MESMQIGETWCLSNAIGLLIDKKNKPPNLSSLQSKYGEEAFYEDGANSSSNSYLATQNLNVAKVQAWLEEVQKARKKLWIC